MFAGDSKLVKNGTVDCLDSDYTQTDDAKRTETRAYYSTLPPHARDSPE